MVRFLFSLASVKIFSLSLAFFEYDICSCTFFGIFPAWYSVSFLVLWFVVYFSNSQLFFMFLLFPSFCSRYPHYRYSALTLLVIVPQFLAVWFHPLFLGLSVWEDFIDIPSSLLSLSLVVSSLLMSSSEAFLISLYYFLFISFPFGSFSAF